MIHRIAKQSYLAALPLAACLMLSACAGMSERISNIGRPIPMSAVGATVPPEQRPVNIPMPPEVAETHSPNSLWQSSRQTFFKDQRAHKVGDIVTVLIDIDDKGKLQNKTTRERDDGENAGLPNLLGVESQLSKVLPEAVNPSSLISGSSTSRANGNGKIDRDEQISLKLAAIVTQVLPNGNFVVRGSQEVRVNNELRNLTLDGIIRPEDILNNNSISYEKIAEARIGYGGQGTLSDVQQARYGQQLYDIVFPF